MHQRGTKPFQLHKGTTQKLVMSSKRLETVDKQFQDWEILNAVDCRHDVTAHEGVFRVVAIVTQTAFNNDEKMFEMSHVVMTINGQVSTTRSMQHNKDTLNKMHVLSTLLFIVLRVKCLFQHQHKTIDPS